MRRTGASIRPLLAGCLMAWMGTAWGVTPAPYDSLKGEAFDQFVTRLKAEPSLLARDRALSFRLSTAQWDQMVQAMELDHYTWVYATTVKANQSPQLAGKRIEALSVVSVRAGKLVPIPFQIDEHDEDGWIYESGVSGKIKGTEGVFDADDELVFMYRDTGIERLDPAVHRLADGRIVQELNYDYNGKTRYAYVAEGSSLRDSSDYVQYDPKKWALDATFFNFRNNPKNILMFEDFRANAGPTPTHRVLDTLIMEISTGVMMPWPRVTVDIRNLQAELAGVKHGPVREVLKLKIWVVVAGIPVFRILTDMTVYDQGITLPVKLHIPGGEILTRVLNKPLIDIALDMNGMKGGRFVSAVNPSGKYHAVDGVITPEEKQLDIRIPDATWLWVESGRGWDVVMKFAIPPDWPVEGRGTYVDAVKPEKSYAYESFPDALPRFGFQVTKLPVGKLDIDLTAILWFPATVGRAGPERFIKQMDNPPRLEAQSPPV